MHDPAEDPKMNKPDYLKWLREITQNIIREHKLCNIQMSLEDQKTWCRESGLFELKAVADCMSLGQATYFHELPTPYL